MERMLPRMILRMEKTARERLVDAGLALLADQGLQGVTLRAAEAAAGVPHGTVRHHFGGLDGYRRSLVAGLADLEGANGDQSVDALVAHWLGPGARLALARYQLMLTAVRDSEIRASVIAARDRFVQRLTEAGASKTDARALVAMLDGLVLDAIVRGDRRPPLRLWHDALDAACVAREEIV